MKHALYNQLAGYYDLIYSRKDYKAEATILRRFIRQNINTRGKDLLEVACGTGRYLEHLEAHFSCHGIDLNGAMLGVAKGRLKKTILQRGDMRSFDLGLRFDVVLCLFNSIANLRTDTELRRTMRNISQHLKPGGLLILGAWLHPGEFVPGVPRLFTYESDQIKIARIDGSKQKGNRAIVDFHWLISEKGKQIKYVPHDLHELTLFSHKQYMDAIRLAKLKPRLLKGKESPTGRLYLALKMKA